MVSCEYVWGRANETTLHERECPVLVIGSLRKEYVVQTAVGLTTSVTEGYLPVWIDEWKTH